MLRRKPPSPTARDVVEHFFEQTPVDKSWDLEDKTDQIYGHVSRNVMQYRRVAVITSGPVAVPLDSAMVTYRATVDTGDRGAFLAEQLLRRKYAVIFIYGEGSYRPFTRIMAKRAREGTLFDDLQVNDKGRVEIGGSDAGLWPGILQSLEEHRLNLLEISFKSLQEYLFLLRIASEALNEAGNRGILCLAACVSKYYIPHADLKSFDEAQHAESFKYSRTPHLMHMIRRDWCPKAFVVGYKLATDLYKLSDQSHAVIEQYGVHLTVGNVIGAAETEFLIVTEREESRVHDGPGALGKAISTFHANYSLELEALSHSKGIMALSAKFCMMRENVSVVDEDADGNKKVPFAVGLRIRADRQAPGSPVYELKAIFKAKSGAARCHVWEKEGLLAKPEILVVFSPAGTPDTVKHFWGDVWSGWLEDELRQLGDSAKQIPFSSYINMILSPMTGDFSELTLLIDGLTKSVGGAWKEAERPRVVQAMRNMFVLGFDRGLSPLDNLLPVDKLLDGLCDEGGDMFIPMAKVNHRRSTEIEEIDLQEKVELLRKAKTVRAHNAVRKYLVEMLEEGVLEFVLSYSARSASINVSGYSMGGMLAHLFTLYLAEGQRRVGQGTENITMTTFGSPRVGDEGFAARLKLLFPDETQLLSVIYPLDTVHAFPPISEGYADCSLKIFLRQEGQFVGRRSPAKTRYLTPLRVLRAVDSKADEFFAKTRRRRRTTSGTGPTEEDKVEPLRSGEGSHMAGGSQGQEDKPPKEAPELGSSGSTSLACGLCGLSTHMTEQHYCKVCTERGSHRGKDCPNKGKGCKLCGRQSHTTGDHKCSVCKLRGHRGRDCHKMSEVGMSELAHYFQFHDFMYYKVPLSHYLDDGDSKWSSQFSSRCTSYTSLPSLHGTNSEQGSLIRDPLPVIKSMETGEYITPSNSVQWDDSLQMAEEVKQRLEREMRNEEDQWAKDAESMWKG